MGGMITEAAAKRVRKAYDGRMVRSNDNRLVKPRN
jgi:hypothetical protein